MERSGRSQSKETWREVIDHRANVTLITQTKMNFCLEKLRLGEDASLTSINTEETAHTELLLIALSYSQLREFLGVFGRHWQCLDIPKDRVYNSKTQWSLSKRVCLAQAAVKFEDMCPAQVVFPELD